MRIFEGHVFDLAFEVITKVTLCLLWMAMYYVIAQVRTLVLIFSPEVTSVTSMSSDQI